MAPMTLDAAHPFAGPSPLPFHLPDFAAIRPEQQARVDTRNAAPPTAKPKAPTESLVAAVVVAGR